MRACVGGGGYVGASCGRVVLVASWILHKPDFIERRAGAYRLLLPATVLKAVIVGKSKTKKQAVFARLRARCEVVAQFEVAAGMSGACLAMAFGRLAWRGNHQWLPRQKFVLFDRHLAPSSAWAWPGNGRHGSVTCAEMPSMKGMACPCGLKPTVNVMASIRRWFWATRFTAAATTGAISRTSSWTCSPGLSPARRRCLQPIATTCSMSDIARCGRCEVRADDQRAGVHMLLQ